MTLFKLDIPPGVRRTGTEYQSQGRWWASQLIRFFQDMIVPFGGWVRFGEVLDGPGRGIITNRASSLARQAIIGTANKVWRWNDDEMVDITPVAYTPGLADTFYGGGYGAGAYGAGPYGESDESGSIPATTWSFDVWGDHILGVASHDRTIYEYHNDDAPMVAVPNAPSALALFVTAERITVAIGAGDARGIQWSDYEDNELWTPDSSNAAGDWRFKTKGTLVAGLAMSRTNLIWSTSDVFRMDHIGGVLIHRFELVPGGAGAGLISSRAMIEGENGTYWMSEAGFWMFDGARAVPLPCELHDYVFGGLNTVEKTKIHAGRLAAAGMVLFFFPTADVNEPNRCIGYCERDRVWVIVDDEGIMARTAWADAGAFQRPIAVAPSGQCYEQERGWTADGEPILEQRYIESGPIEVGNGDRVIEATKLISDEKTAPGMQVHFTQRQGPNGQLTRRGPYEVTPPTTDIRVTARQVSMRLEALADEDFRFGRQRLDGKAGGFR